MTTEREPQERDDWKLATDFLEKTGISVIDGIEWLRRNNWNVDISLLKAKNSVEFTESEDLTAPRQIIFSLDEKGIVKAEVDYFLTEDYINSVDLLDLLPEPYIIDRVETFSHGFISGKTSYNDLGRSTSGILLAPNGNIQKLQHVLIKAR